MNDKFLYEFLIRIVPENRYEIFRTYAQSKDEAIAQMKKWYPASIIEDITIHEEEDSSKNNTQ